MRLISSDKTFQLLNKTFWPNAQGLSPRSWSTFSQTEALLSVPGLHMLMLIQTIGLEMHPSGCKASASERSIGEDSLLGFLGDGGSC